MLKWTQAQLELESSQSRLSLGLSMHRKHTHTHTHTHTHRQHTHTHENTHTHTHEKTAVSNVILRWVEKHLIQSAPRKAALLSAVAGTKGDERAPCSRQLQRQQKTFKRHHALGITPRAKIIRTASWGSLKDISKRQPGWRYICLVVHNYRIPAHHAVLYLYLYLYIYIYIYI